MRALLILCMTALLTVFCPAQGKARVWEYEVISDTMEKLSDGSFLLRLLITTAQRDMSRMTGRDLAETAEAAYQDMLKKYPLARFNQVNVLLFESRYMDGVALARASHDASGQRILRAIKGHGPTAQQINVSEVIGILKGGVPKATAKEHYAQAAKRLGITKELAEKEHLAVAELFATTTDYPEVIGHVQAKGPFAPRKP